MPKNYPSQTCQPACQSLIKLESSMGFALCSSLTAFLFRTSHRHSGRFSGLTNVGLLPAAIAELDVKALRQGALTTLKTMLTAKDAASYPPALGAALAASLAQNGKTISVMMPYADRLDRFAHWFLQLWGESLGKLKARAQHLLPHSVLLINIANCNSSSMARATNSSPSSQLALRAKDPS